MIEVYYYRDYVQVKHLNRCCNSHQVNNLVGIFIKDDILTWKKYVFSDMNCQGINKNKRCLIKVNYRIIRNNVCLI